MDRVIEFENCRITKVEHQIRNGLVRSVLHMAAAMNHDTARMLGVYPLIYSPDGVPKFGFNKIGLTVDLDEAFRLYLAIAGLELYALDLQADGADAFVVIRKKERLGMTFKIVTLSNPHEILDWQIRHGEAFGFCSFHPIPVQGGLDLPERAKIDPPPTAPVDGKTAAAGADEGGEETAPPEVQGAPGAADTADDTTGGATGEPGATDGPVYRDPRDPPPLASRDNIDSLLKHLERDFGAEGAAPV